MVASVRPAYRAAECSPSHFKPLAGHLQNLGATTWGSIHDGSARHHTAQTATYSRPAPCRAFPISLPPLAPGTWSPGALPVFPRWRIDRGRAGAKAMSRPDELTRAKAHGRIALLMSGLIPRLDAILVACAEARVSAPGILEMIDWAEYSLEQVAIAATPDLDIHPDPIKDAQAAAVNAARRNNSADYAAAKAAAKAAETIARAAA